MRIYVIRHGETEMNVKRVKQGWMDAPLNQSGRELAVLTGRALQGVHFDGCISSPLSRARETVEIVLRESGNAHVPVRTDDRLKEIHFGLEEGRPAQSSTMPQETAELFFKDAFRFPGFPEGESIQDLCGRTDAFMRDFLHGEKEGTWLIGTHGCTLRALLNPFYEHPERFWQGCVPPNCSITILEVTDGRPHIVESDRIFYDPALLVDHYRGIIRN